MHTIQVFSDDAIAGVINRILVGKPQDEAYYQEYKDVFQEVVDNENMPIVYNVNFGHAAPRCVLPYGVEAKVDMNRKKIYLEPSC